MDAKDTLEITTPSGKKVVIRNYTTHGDDLIALRILNEGITATTDTSGNSSVVISVVATNAADAKYVELLVQSIDGNSVNIVDQLGALRSDDYDVIDIAVKGITSPKVSSKSKLIS
jgi:hypothetical protein